MTELAQNRQADDSSGIEALRRLHEAGRLPEAEAGYRALLEAEPGNADAWHLYGVIAFQQGRLKLAAERISRALQLRPDSAPPLCNLGSVMMAMGQAEQAEKLFRTALRIRPDHADTAGNLGVLLHKLGRNGEAIPWLARACELRPEHGMAFNNLGNALGELERYEEALDAYRRAVDLSDNPAFLGAMGHAYQQVGDHDEALKCFRRALRRDPHCVSALCGMAVSRRIEPGDPEVRLFLESFNRFDRMEYRDKVNFLFAWGKLNDDLGEHEQAFACLAKANKLRRQSRPYSRSFQEDRLDQIRRIFTPERLRAPTNGGSDSERPLFILGMPRSGTTLTEQVLASHPQVHGGGELKGMSRAVEAFLVSEVNGRKILDPELLTPGNITEAAECYLDALPGWTGDAIRTTDKMPANFRHIGYIALMFPRARIVHVRRNPVDTLLSCFQQNFGQGQAFSNDLEDAAHYYWIYSELMRHWHALLGERILTVDYERLVEDPEGQSRRLCRHIGLEWHEAMLTPHRTRRSIRTASKWQVRQPIHRASVERWRRYEKQLRPLLAALEAYSIHV